MAKEIRNCYDGLPQYNYLALMCDKCGRDVDELYIVGDEDEDQKEELCEECAKDKIMDYIVGCDFRVEELCDMAAIGYKQIDINDFIDDYDDDGDPIKNMYL